VLSVVPPMVNAKSNRARCFEAGCFYGDVVGAWKKSWDTVRVASVSALRTTTREFGTARVAGSVI